MDYDGSNQTADDALQVHFQAARCFARWKDVRLHTWSGKSWQIMVHSADTSRKLPFYNPVSSAIETPEFTPDGKRMLFAATVNGWVQICIADVNGGEHAPHFARAIAGSFAARSIRKTGGRCAVYLRAQRDRAAVAHEYRRSGCREGHERRRLRRESRVEPERAD